MPVGKQMLVRGCYQVKCVGEKLHSLSVAMKRGKQSRDEAGLQVDEAASCLEPHVC